MDSFVRRFTATVCCGEKRHDTNAGIETYSRVQTVSTERSQQDRFWLTGIEATSAIAPVATAAKIERPSISRHS